VSTPTVPWSDPSRRRSTTGRTAGPSRQTAPPERDQNEIKRRGRAGSGGQRRPAGRRGREHADHTRTRSIASVEASSYTPRKAANAGGVAVSGLEMTQDIEHLSLDPRAGGRQVEADHARDPHQRTCRGPRNTAGRATTSWAPTIAGFVKVADAMVDESTDVNGCGAVSIASSESLDKGLKSGALGLVSSIVIRHRFHSSRLQPGCDARRCHCHVGFHAPLVAIGAFVPMLLISIGYSELNKADPTAGRPHLGNAKPSDRRRAGAGGWGIIASDVLVMASLAEVARSVRLPALQRERQSVTTPTSPWCSRVGVLWIVVLAYICYRGIEVSAWSSASLLAIELVMLAVYAIVAIIAGCSGTRATGPHGAYPCHGSTRRLCPSNSLVDGLVLMLFIYWGWDTSLSVNEETSDKERLPGLAGIIATSVAASHLRARHHAAQAFAGVGTTGIGLANPAHLTDVLSRSGHRQCSGRPGSARSSRTSCFSWCSRRPRPLLRRRSFPRPHSCSTIRSSKLYQSEDARRSPRPIVLH